MRYWDWRKLRSHIANEEPKPDPEKQAREQYRDQILADMADMLRCHATMLPTAPPKVIGRIHRQLLDAADALDALQVVKHEPTLGLEAMVTSLYRSEGH